MREKQNPPPKKNRKNKSQGMRTVNKKAHVVGRVKCHCKRKGKSKFVCVCRKLTPF